MADVIHRVGRTPLGAAYRSRLGVLTRPNLLFRWRMIVCIEPGYGMVINETEIRAKYQAIRDALAKEREVTLEFNDRWLFEMAGPFPVGPNHVRNLVFIVGGGNPTVFDYFKNYVYGKSSEQMFGGVTEHSETTVNGLDSFNFSLLPEIGGTWTPEEQQAFIDSRGMVEQDPDAEVISSTLAVCIGHDDGYFYDTDYVPGLDAVLNDTWTFDLSWFDIWFQYNQSWSELYDISEKTIFFFDPLEEFRPTEQDIDTTPYIKHYAEHVDEFPTETPLVLYFTFHWPPGSGIFEGIASGYLLVIHWSDLWFILNDTSTVTTGPLQHYYCSSLTPEDGSLTQYVTEYFDSDYVLTNTTPYRIEGVDQTHDSADLTEELLMAIAARHSEQYHWSYRGRVDSLTLTPAALKAMLPASAFS